MNFPPPATPRAPGRRAKASATSSNGEELAGEEVLELKLFAEKKVWIEEKIQFLSSLPPIEVTTPEPPACSPVSHDELEAWWTEHDRIEREIQAYDMGDLTKMRNIARERSKQELSPRDTDLIELTLTTLFAVDKLLSLLRQRRQALTLLGYRLKWEEATAAARTSRQRLLADLPAFLAKARWRPASTGDSGVSRSTTDFLAPASELGRSSSSTSLAASPSLRDLSTLSSSRSSSALRASATTTNLLSLSLSTLTTQSRTLSSSAVPLSASFLDKLIDSSSIPLPESFLDEQDRLEDSVKAISEGLQDFAEQLVAQRSAAEELFLRISAISTGARELESDVQSGQAELPSLPTSSDFAPRLLSLERDLNDVRADLVDLPRPLHPSAPDQATHNSELVATLQQHLRDANEAARSAEAAVARYSADRRIVDSAQAVGTRLVWLSDELSAFQRGVEAIVTRPATLDDGLAVLESTGSGAVFEQEWDRLAARVTAAVEQADPVQKDAARCVVELAERKICDSLRKEIKEAAANVRAQRQRVAALLEGETRRRDEVAAVREAFSTTERVSNRAREAEKMLMEEGEAAKWREGRMAPAEAEDIDAAARDIRREVDDLFSIRVAPVLASLDSAALGTLHRQLAESVAAVTRRINSLDNLASQVVGLRQQSRRVQAFVEEVEVATTRLRKLLYELDAVVGGPAEAIPGDDEISLMRGRLDDCSRTVEGLVETAATSVPFLAPASPSPSSDKSGNSLNLTEQDEHVRSFVNTSCARLAGLVDEARQSFGVLAVLQKARKWDADFAEIERKVAVVEETERARENSQTQNLTISALLDDDSSHPSVSTLDLGPLSSALEDLCYACRGSSDEIDLRATRRARLEQLRDRCDRLSHSTDGALQSQPSFATRQTSSVSSGRDAVPLRETDMAAIEQQAPAEPRSTAALAPAVDDVVHDPFTLDPPLDEPAALKDLRRRVGRIETANWLSPVTLVLPSTKDAADLGGAIAICRDELTALVDGTDDTLVWADFPTIEREIEEKDKEIRRITALARFAKILAKADSSLSDLLNAVDAATPDALPVTPDPAASPVLPLSEALVAASEAVTVVRVEAIPLADDGRVARAISRIEDTWSEMLGLVEEIRPQAGSTASSASSLSSTVDRHAAQLVVPPRTPSRPSSQAISLRSTRSSLSRSTSRTSASSSLADSSFPTSGPGALAPQTPRPRRSTSDDQTPRSRRSSRLPVRTPRQALSPLPPNPSTVPQPFSFDTPVKLRSNESVRSASRRDSSTASLRKVPVTPRGDRHASSALFSQSSVRRSNLFSSVADERPRADRPSTRSVSTPVVRTARHTPPRSKQPYRPNVYNKLDREVANVVNSMPGLHIPIQVAEGRWTDESGVYNIGGRLYFCRILRSKQVMVRVGGGWLDLSQFIITHFGVANGLTISPSTSITANLGNEPQWISSSTLRDSLAASESSNALRDYLASSISSASKSDLGLSTSAISVSRPFSRRPRDSLGYSSRDRATPASVSTAATPRAKTPRPPLPVWRP